MLGIAVFLVLCQQPVDLTRSAQAAEMIMSAQAAAQTARLQEANARERREFAMRFNRLITALKDFESAYSQNRGEVWPTKQAAKLDVAMRELTSYPGWRRSN